MESDLDQVHRRPGGRSARIRQDVLDATLEVLSTEGYAAVTLDTVATRAGVHRTTLHRRWGTPIALVLDALFERSEEVIGTIDTGTLVGDLEALLAAVRANLESPLGSAVTIALAAERSPDVAAASRRFWERRFEVVGPLVERAVDRGELVPIEPARFLELAVAPLFFRLLVQHGTIDADLVADVISSMTVGSGAPASAITVRVTHPDRAGAEAVADRLVSGGYAACVHVTEHDSVYTWKGALERAHEVELAITTTRARRADVIAVIRDDHPDELPAIGWTALDGTPEYVAWIAESVQIRSK